MVKGVLARFKYLVMFLVRVPLSPEAAVIRGAWGLVERWGMLNDSIVGGSSHATLPHWGSVPGGAGAVLSLIHI